MKIFIFEWKDNWNEKDRLKKKKKEKLNHIFFFFFNSIVKNKIYFLMQFIKFIRFITIFYLFFFSSFNDQRGVFVYL